jgi:isoamylase
MRNFEPDLQDRTSNQLLKETNRSWHGVKLGEPDWSFSSHSLATSVAYPNQNLFLYLILNAYWEPLEFELPPVNKDRAWKRWIDTTFDSPDDIVEWHSAPTVESPAYLAGPRSVVALFAPLGGQGL